MGRWLLHILHSAERVSKNEVIFTSNKAVSGNLESDVEGAESVGGIGRALCRPGSPESRLGSREREGWFSYVDEQAARFKY